MEQWPLRKPRQRIEISIRNEAVTMSTTTIPTSIVPGDSGRASFVSEPTDPYSDSERSFEIVKGKLVEKTMGLIENLIASFLFERLAPFCRERQLGRVVIETSFAIPGSENIRIPDGCFCFLSKLVRQATNPAE